MLDRFARCFVSESSLGAVILYLLRIKVDFYDHFTVAEPSGYMSSCRNKLKEYSLSTIILVLVRAGFP